MTKRETYDEKAKRMTKVLPERIAAAREGAAEVYGVVKPAAEHAKARAARQTPKPKRTP
jgi:hypothetical protein